MNSTNTTLNGTKKLCFRQLLMYQIKLRILNFIVGSRSIFSEKWDPDHKKMVGSTSPSPSCRPLKFKSYKKGKKSRFFTNILFLLCSDSQKMAGSAAHSLSCRPENLKRDKRVHLLYLCTVIAKFAKGGVPCEVFCCN
jgi:hypothetical protein